jgi:hypothetical protein
MKESRASSKAEAREPDSGIDVESRASSGAEAREPDSEIDARERNLTALLSGTKPQTYNCCANTCCAYTSSWLKDTECPICSEPHFDEEGKPCQCWEYLPVMQCLQAYLGVQR